MADVLFKKGLEATYQSMKTAGTLSDSTFYNASNTGNLYLGEWKLTNEADSEVYAIANTTSEYASSVTIYQGDKVDNEGTISPGPNAKIVGTINVPLDMVVSGGSVVDITYDDGKLYDGVTDVTELIKGVGGTATAEDAGKYIKLTIANSSGTVLYINCKDLIDIYTGGDTAEISVTVTGNVITATVVKVSGAKVVYRASSSEHYDQVQPGATFDEDTDYYTYDDGTETYTLDSTVTAENFDTKIAAGLYTYTPAVSEQSINAKVSEVENYIGTIPQSATSTNVVDYVNEQVSEHTLTWGTF